MLNRFYPNEYVKSVHDIDYERLLRKGIHTLIFDIDNTLAPFDEELPPDGVVGLIGKLLAMGFKICLLSNNHDSRVVAFNINLKLPAVARAKKPTKTGIIKALNLTASAANKAAQIGDQVFTDVWCGNRCGLYTILVEPVSGRDEFTVKLKRGVEKLVIQSYLKRVEKVNIKK